MRRPTARAALGILLVVAIAVLLSWTFLLLNNRDQSTCRQVDDLRVSVRGILERGQAAVRVSPTLTDEQRAQALRFYAEAIDDLRSPDCGSS